ncbi:hypothetical protein V6N12_026417 [Hibiscus sabdariffa]|uniref:Cytochrome P450 n=1 Tax=Hibiscus sabdariffa TaxID=183260 RepID=A0ABR2DRQ0_9ROSI
METAHYRQPPSAGEIRVTASPNSERFGQSTRTLNAPSARRAFHHRCFITEVAKDVMITHGLNFANRPYVAALDIVTYGSRDVAMAPYGSYWRQSDGVLQGIIDEHRAGLKRGITSEGEAKEDLVTVLLKIQQQGGLEFPLTDKDIKGIIWVSMSLFCTSYSNMYVLKPWFMISQDIFGGGGETSSTTVDWAMSEMVRNPRVLKKAQNEIRQICHGTGDVDEASIKEMKYLALVIKETLRLHPPFPLLLPRESREDCEANGYQVPYKAKIIINAWAIGRDPKYWNKPEAFYPERFLDNSIDFKGTDLVQEEGCVQA